MNAKNIVYGLISISIVILCYSCAKIGTLQGGLKDEKAPKVIKNQPLNYSTSFKEKSFELFFNEFVQLNNISDELIVSPPLKEKPEVLEKGKSILIKINNDLIKNTTYTFNFGNGIKDLNEGNILQNFEYVFSTGSYIDSLSIAGTVVNAFDKKIPEKCLIILQDTISDSALYKNFPRYIAKTNKEGKFRINNINTDTFQLFALVDLNSNYLFDQSSEQIAFLDTLLFIDQNYFVPRKIEKDTFNRDSTLALLDSTIKSDSIKMDTSIYDDKNLKKVNLFLFSEEFPSEKIYLKDNKRSEARKFQFIFNVPLIDSLSISFPDTIVNPCWSVLERSRNNDTLIYWITDSSLIKSEKIKTILTYKSYDSLLKLVDKNDTINLSFKSKIPKKKKENDKDKLKDTIKVKIPGIPLNINVSEGKMIDLYANLMIESITPIKTLNTEKIKLFSMKDTIETPIQFKVKPILLEGEKDTFNHLRKYKIEIPWKEDSKYRLLIENGFITDIYNKQNDSILTNFSTQKLDYYGKIIVNLSNVNSPVILQLLDDKENVLKENYTTKDGDIVFDYLNPQEYQFKVIYDLNNNKKWDTGKYSKKQQPERVAYSSEKIKVKSNWDHDIKWKLE